jgi:hypothetical protein
VLSIVTAFRHSGGGSSGPTQLLPALGLVRIEEGRETVAEFDASAFAPGKLEARLILDPEMLRASRVVLHGRGGKILVEGGSRSHEIQSDWTLGEFLPSPTGDLRVDNLPPGEYTLSISLDDGTHETHRFVELPRSVIIRAGERTTCSFEFPRARLRLRLLSAEGQPLAKTACKVMTEHHSIRMSTDADGWITLDPAPGVPVRLSADGHGVSEPVVIPDGHDHAELSVKLSRED